MNRHIIYGYQDALKEKRKRRKIRFAFLIVCSLAAFIIFAAYALFFSGWFTIKGIEAKGNKEVGTEEIEKLAEGYLNRVYFLGYIKPFSNILFADLGDIENMLAEKFPVIKTVDVDRNFFRRRLDIEVAERKPAGIWCRDGEDRCFYFDEDAIFFKPSPKFSGEVFLTIQDGRGGNFKETDIFDDLELLRKIDSAKKILDELKIVDYSSFFLPRGSFEFWIKTKEGWHIYLDKENDVPMQLVALKKFLDEKLPAEKRKTIEYIDLRVNNRIYYK